MCRRSRNAKASTIFVMDSNPVCCNRYISASARNCDKNVTFAGDNSLADLNRIAGQWRSSSTVRRMGK